MCGADDIGRTHQQLEIQSGQHMSSKIHRGRCDNLCKLVTTSGSAIAEHLIVRVVQYHLAGFPLQ